MNAIRTAATLAIGLLIGASAMAVAETPPETYTGCLTKEGVILRVAVGSAPAHGCRPNEQLISWNSQGPKGDPGEPGAGGGLETLDDLDGTPCNVGDPGEGTLEVRYDVEGPAMLNCVASAMYALTISFTGDTPGHVRVWGAAADPLECTTNDDPCSFQVRYGTQLAFSADGLDGARAFLTWTEGPLVGIDSTMWDSVGVRSDIVMVGFFTAWTE